MHTVLIVDDSDFLRIAIRNLLVKHGFDVVGEAPNGMEGLALYKKLKPNEVIMDVTMDVMDGITACGEINKYDPNAVVIILSAIIGQKEHQEAAWKNGAKAVLAKPFGLKRLHEVIHEQLTPLTVTAQENTTALHVEEDVKFLAEQLAIVKIACSNEREIYAYDALTSLKERQWKPQTTSAIETLRRMIYAEGDFKSAMQVVDDVLDTLI